MTNVCRRAVAAYVRRIALVSALSCAAVAGSVVASPPDLLGGSCDTGDARTVLDPVETFNVLPAAGPVELEGNGSGGIRIVSAGAPRSVVVASPDTFRGRNVTAVSFFFRSRTRARIDVTASNDATDLERAVYVERDSTVCSNFNTQGALPGTPIVAAGNPDAEPVFVAITGETGSFDITFDLTFSPNVVYRLAMSASNSKGPTLTAAAYDLFAGAEDVSITPDPALKLLSSGADPSTGCPGTDVSNIEEAILALLKARNHATIVSTRFDTSDPVRTAPAKTDDERVRKLVALARAHLECARRIVERRDDLPDQTKQLVLTDIGNSLADCDAAEAALDEPLPDVRNANVRDASQLRTAASRLGDAISDARVAGQTLGGGFSEPTLPVGYASNDPVADAATVMGSASTRHAEELANLQLKVAELREVARTEGRAGLARILASNRDTACLEFLQSTLLAELFDVAVAADRLARDDAILQTTAERREAAAIRAQAEREARQMERALRAVATAAASGGDSSSRAQGRLNRALSNVSRVSDKAEGNVSKRQAAIADLTR